MGLLAENFDLVTGVGGEPSFATDAARAGTAIRTIHRRDCIARPRRGATRRRFTETPLRRPQSRERTP